MFVIQQKTAYNSVNILNNKSLDCIYLDPPFYTNKNFKDFKDKWDNMDEYLATLVPVIYSCWAKLKETGVILVHCDYHAVHYIKIELDMIFGIENFSNEILTKRAAKNGVNIVKRLFKNEDRLMVYWKDIEKGKIYIPPTKPRDPDGAKWASLTGGGNGPGMYFGDHWIIPPVGRHYMWSQTHVTEQWNMGNIRLTKGGNPQYRILRDVVSVGTLWDDIPTYSKKHDYSTEKSVELMTRILNMYTIVGDTVGDFYMGSGPMAEACYIMNRQYTGSDQNKDAIDITTERISLLKPLKEKDGDMLDV